MKEKQFFKTLKNKFIFVLALILSVCFVAFTLVACTEDDSSSDYEEPTYSYTTETDSTETISNNNFDKEAKSISSDKFPYTTSGWTKAVDNSAKTSEINSGVISVTSSNWTTLLETLCKDNDFVKYLENNGKTKETAGELFANPGKAGEDDFVYMLNNYLTSRNNGLGTAQKLTSSSKITLEKGKVAKITVAVKTANLLGYNDGLGANIRLVNTVANSTQSEFQIKNIISDSVWTTYEIYVKADKIYDNTITLVLGLGFGNGSSNYSNTTEGTAYFDNITYEVLDDTATLPSIDANNVGVLSYGSDDKVKIDAGTSTKFMYDMTVQNTSSSLIYTDVDFNSTSNYLRLTTSNIQGVGTKGSFTSQSTSEQIDVTLDKASLSAKIDNNGSDFEVESGKFSLISFDVLNGLSKFGSTNITIDLFEKNGSSYVKKSAIATFSTVSEDVTNCKILVKNNFPSGSRYFYIDVVIGPTNVANDLNDYDFASGNVVLSNLKVMNDTVRESEADDYKLYALYTSSPSATVNLYAGYSADYTEDEDTAANYNLNVTPGSVGEIASYPVSVKGYDGITTDSAYISGDSTATTVINERTEGGVNGSYAGLINTEYLANYTGFGDEQKLTEALALAKLDLDADTYIQPLMIYNNDFDRYGFVGDSYELASGAYASVTIKLRVADGAKAFVYLVDTANVEKQVMTFENVAQNNEYKFIVDESMMQEDGWVSLTFYIANGATTRNFRVEVWNGGRTTAEEASKGYVFVNSVSVGTSSAFTEATRYEDAFTVSGNPLYNISRNDIIASHTHTKELSELEEQFNEDYPDEEISYRPSYVWVTTKTMIYSSFNTYDPVATDPYADKVEEEVTEDSGCTAESDPSTFWLSFSSILLGAVLVLALIALIVKRVVIKRKASANDARAHYNVSSRAKARKDIERKNRIANAQKVDEEEIDPEYTLNEESETTEQVEEEISEEVEETKTEESLDDYVYGDVQSFGDEIVAEPTSNEEENEDKE